MTSRTAEQGQRLDGSYRPDSEAVACYRRSVGFVPNIVHAQSSVPRLIEADLAVSTALASGGLSPVQRELLQLAVAVGHENLYEAALRSHILAGLGFTADRLSAFVFDYREADLPAADVALLDFVLTLSRHPTRITSRDVEGLRMAGFGDERIVEVGFLAAWSNYRCVLASGVGSEPDVAPPWIPPPTLRKTVFRPPASSQEIVNERRPFVCAPELRPESFAPFARLQARGGVIPNVLQAQTLRPDLIEAQVAALDRVLLAPGALSRVRKEYIFLAVSAANLSSYCVALHCAVLRSLGVTSQQTEQIAIDHRQANLATADHALLDAALELARSPSGPRRTPISLLCEQGFCETEIVEATAVVAIAYFTNTLSTAVGAEPDFPPAVFLERRTHPFLSPRHQTDLERTESADRQDPDHDSVARVRGGDADAFEDLVRRHGRRIHRVLGGMLRNEGDVDDAVQETFLKAYEKIHNFEGRSLFVTWLTRVAINIALQRLRRRKEAESLDEDPTTLERLQPKELQPWQANPEQAYSRSEMRDLIVEAVQALPLKYRTAVMLRDFQQLSTQESAAALEISVPALKARLFRARLMLRDALTPHFARNPK